MGPGHCIGETSRVELIHYEVNDILRDMVRNLNSGLNFEVATRCNKARFLLKLTSLRNSSAHPASWLEILHVSRRTDGNF